MKSLIIFFIVLTNLSHASEWKELFNGKNLEGWKGFDQYWSVQGGVITGESKKDIPFTNFLVYKNLEFSDFELSVDVRIFSGNSGIQYRSTKKGKNNPHGLKGYQADLDDKNEWTGTIYAQGRGIMAK